MRKTLLALTGAAALCASTGTVLAADHSDHGSDHGVGKGHQNAAQTCKAQRAQIGVAAFRQLYGTNKNKRNAFGKCVSAKETS
jgi:hypothetical protein